MFLAAMLGITSPSWDQGFVASLASIINPQAVVYLRGELEKPTEDSKFRLVFLDSKGGITGQITAPDTFGDIVISPDGTMAVATFYTLNPEKDTFDTDFVVASKEGQLARLHEDNLASVRWVGGRLIVFGSQMPLTSFGPDATTKEWSAKKISEHPSKSLLPVGDSFWASQNTDLVEFDPNLKVTKTVSIGEELPTLMATIPDSDQIITSTIDDPSNESGGFQRITLWDTKTGMSRILTKLGRSDVGVWLSGPRRVGFLTQLEGNKDEVVFVSPIAGRSLQMGPANLFTPTLAALDATHAIVVGQNGGQSRIYIMDPETQISRTLPLPMLPSPDYVAPCR